MVFDQLTSLVVGFFVVAAVGGIIYYARTKHPDLTVGDLINAAMVREKVSIFVLLNILINVAEGMAAASISPEGEAEINFIARLFVHFSISFAAIVSNIMFPIIYSMAWQIRKDKEKRGRMWGYVAMGNMLFISALGFPFLNLVIIAGGLNQTDMLFWAISNLDFRAFDAMPYILQAACGATIVHYTLATTDAGWIMLNPSAAMSDAVNKSLQEIAGKSSSSKSSPDKKNAEKKKKQNISNKDDAIKYLLSRYGYDGSKLQNMVKTASSKFDSMDEPKRNKLADELAKIYSDIETWDKSEAKKSLTDNQKRDKNNLFLQRIYDLFKESEAGRGNKVGFGMTLKDKSSVKN